MPRRAGRCRAARPRRGGRRQYDTFTFRRTRGRQQPPGQRAARTGASRPARGSRCWCRPSIEFISLVFALFKAGAVIVLIDPGMGRAQSAALPGRGRARRLHRDSAGAGGARARARRVSAGPLQRHRRPAAVLGRADARRAARPRQQRADLPRHQRRRSGGHHLHHRQHRPAQGRALSPRQFRSAGDRDWASSTAFSRAKSIWPAFPLFGLFNCALGVTTVIPDMDPTRPARVDPRNIVEADPRLERDAGVWLAGDLESRRPVLRGAQRLRLPTLRRVLSAGAPVPPHVLARMKGVHRRRRRRAHALRRRPKPCRWLRSPPAKC